MSNRQEATSVQITARALNRATLGRQLQLHRESQDVSDAVLRRRRWWSKLFGTEARLLPGEGRGTS